MSFRTYELRKCDIWSVMKIAFLMCGVTGFILGLFYAILLTIIGGILDMIWGGRFEEISGLFSGLFGFFMAFALAFTYAVLGSIMAAILAWLYNLFARLVGGIRLTLEPVSVLSPRRGELNVPSSAAATHPSQAHSEEEPSP
jgi:hypothetical protein